MISRVRSLALAGAVMAIGAASVFAPCYSGAATAAVENEAQAAWKALKAELRGAPPSEDFFKKSPSEQMRINDDQVRRASERALGFYHDHPKDPVRWEAAVYYVERSPIFVKDFPPGYDQAPDFSKLIRDQEAVARWKKEVLAITQAATSARDISDENRETLLWSAFGADFQDMASRYDKGEAVDWNVLMERFRAHITRYPAKAVERADDFLGGLESTVKGASIPEWRQLRNSSNAALSAKAKAALQRVDPNEVFDLKFTAIDGREVDTAQMRGKVILVDFWATWCGPCIAELPNVKEVYRKYQAAGFEIIGVSLDEDKNRQAFIDLTRKEGVTWPQYFDGKAWSNDLAVRYGIKALPAMFLIDRNGKIASINARGEKLSTEVKKLLGL